MAKIIFDAENEKRPYIAANGIIIKKINGKEHILLGKRKNVHGAGYYYLPGGHVKEGELMNDTLKREIKEETGLEIIPGELLWLEEVLKTIHHVITYWRAIMKDKNAIPVNLEPNKCEGWQWFPIDSPPRPLWQTLSRFLKQYLKKQKTNFFGTRTLTKNQKIIK
jgi:8-oxo-dGTP diphosphatase